MTLFFDIILLMKLAPKTQQNQGDYSGLSAAELLAMITQNECVIAQQKASLSVQDQQLQSLG